MTQNLKKEFASLKLIEAWREISKVKQFSSQSAHSLPVWPKPILIVHIQQATNKIKASGRDAV
jgi:hypothetical protein